MTKHKYVVTTGWWCPDVMTKDTRSQLIGDASIRKKDFFSLWLKAVTSYTKPKKILVVDSASPIKPDTQGEPQVEIVSLDCNAGHSTNHLGKYAGVTRAHIMGMLYALSCEVDYWVYIEQDALIYGDGIVEECIDKLESGIMFGGGSGTPQPMQQSFMIMKTELIPSFIKRLTGIKASDYRISPEMKFAMCTSRVALVLPEVFFYENHHTQEDKKLLSRIYRKIGRILIKKLVNFDTLPVDYGRKRPINFNAKHFYFQHGCDFELKKYLTLIDR